MSTTKQESTISSIFGQRLSEFRKQRQMTQQELADALGVSKSMVNYYENRAKNPTLETVDKAAKILNVPVEELITLNSKKRDTPPQTKLDFIVQKIRLLSAHKQRMVISGLEGMLNAK